MTQSSIVFIGRCHVPEQDPPYYRRTGSFGNAVLKRFLDTNISEIRIFSRDEKKPDDMRKRFNHPKLKFYISNVRDARSVAQAMRTNVLGTKAAGNSSLFLAKSAFSPRGY